VFLWTSFAVNSSVFLDVTSCSPLKAIWRFGGTCYLHLQDRRISQARNQCESKWQAESEPEPELLYDWRFTADQFVLATNTLRPTARIFIFQLNACGYSPCLQLLLILSSAFTLRSQSRGTHDHILLSQIRDSPNLEDQVPVFIFARKRVARLYPQALGFLFVASYDSKGYGGGIRPRLHTDRVENTVSDSSSVVACVSVAAGTSLPCHFLAVLYSY
jgi:hypothetical protein